jgi:hypothetical protein
MRQTPQLRFSMRYDAASVSPDGWSGNAPLILGPQGVISVDFQRDQPQTSVYLAIEQKLLSNTPYKYYSNHQLISGPWSEVKGHFGWITSTLAGMVHVVTRVSTSIADLDYPSEAWPSFPQVTAAASTAGPPPETYYSGRNVVTVQVWGS